MTAFRRTLTTAIDIADAGLISEQRAAEIAEVSARYAVAITPAMAALIDPSDPHDPIARQFVPDNVSWTACLSRTAIPSAITSRALSRASCTAILIACS